MCGICGQIRFNDQPVKAHVIQQMTEAMRSRGPDGWGLRIQNQQALGHRRLKIIDLSERAQQPMTDSALRLSIVYNGAIYNYRELRSELEKYGYRFFSDGDTEVILKAYHLWGPDCVKRFNGMFAFVISHTENNSVFAARDRLGIKPFYYVHEHNHFSFASDLPALVHALGITPRIDPVALHHYMTFHSVIPAPLTIFKTVRKLPPGSFLTIDPRGKKSLETYWSLEFDTPQHLAQNGIAEWSEQVYKHLKQAVQRRMNADVPVGVLLSGGLDSSFVVGLLHELGHADINTFSIGFEAAGDEAGDEFVYSDRVASHFETKHHKIWADADMVMDALQACVRAMSEPMMSHDCIGFYLLSQQVSKHVKVVQSGQGADEVFGGYHWYPPLLNSTQGAEDYARHFCDRSHTEYQMAVQPSYVGHDYSRELIEKAFDTNGSDNAVDKALCLDTTVMLVDDPVKRVDNMTMAWGLEARVPFLDHELVELAARIPAGFKIPEGGKYVLKEAARKILPAEVIDRPKGYFPVPALKYIEGPYLNFMRDILQTPKSLQRGLFNPDFVGDVLERPTDHITPLNGATLWQMAVLTYWLDLHGF